MLLWEVALRSLSVHWSRIGVAHLRGSRSGEKRVKAFDILSGLWTGCLSSDLLFMGSLLLLLCVGASA